MTPTRQTVSAGSVCGGFQPLPPPVGVHEVDPRTAAAGEGRDDGAEGGRGAAVASDHLAEVVGVDPDLEDRAATQLLVADRDVVGVVDDAAHQVLESLGQHDQASLLPASSAVTVSVASAASAAPSGVSEAGTSAGASAAGAGSSAFLS